MDHLVPGHLVRLRSWQHDYLNIPKAWASPIPADHRYTWPDGLRDLWHVEECGVANHVTLQSWDGWYLYFWEELRESGELGLMTSKTKDALSKTGRPDRAAWQPLPQRDGTFEFRNRDANEWYLHRADGPATEHGAVQAYNKVVPGNDWTVADMGPLPILEGKRLTDVKQLTQWRFDGAGALVRLKSFKGDYLHRSGSPHTARDTVEVKPANDSASWDDIRYLWYVEKSSEAQQLTLQSCEGDYLVFESELREAGGWGLTTDKEPGSMGSWQALPQSDGTFELRNHDAPEWYLHRANRPATEPGAVQAYNKVVHGNDWTIEDFSGGPLSQSSTMGVISDDVAWKDRKWLNNFERSWPALLYDPPPPADH